MMSSRQQVRTSDVETPSLELSASDETISAACDHADPMVLRGLIYQLTAVPDIAATSREKVSARTLEVAAPAEEELALNPNTRSLQWQQLPPRHRLDTFSVIVGGAGMGGLNAAFQLKRAGIRFTVIEKDPGVGGTWYENRYPGCRLMALRA